ncbi:MAG: 4'-phosphopantetheinyl transferase superfamily protein, partial [Planctomycetales bacterium]
RDPAAWRFSHNAHGKPAIAEADAEADVGNLRFNLSHTAGLVICGVCRDAEIGVDTEDVQRPRLNLELAQRYFAPSEAECVRLAEPERQRDVFFHYWTLKEAYVKARGKGLAIPLSDFSFTRDEHGVARIAFLDDRECPEDWRFVEIRLDSRYRIALAVHLPNRQPLCVQVHETVPLLFQSPPRLLEPNDAQPWEIQSSDGLAENDDESSTARVTE